MAKLLNKSSQLINYLSQQFVRIYEKLMTKYHLQAPTNNKLQQIEKSINGSSVKMLFKHQKLWILFKDNSFRKLCHCRIDGHIMSKLIKDDPRILYTLSQIASNLRDDLFGQCSDLGKILMIRGQETLAIKLKNYHKQIYFPANLSQLNQNQSQFDRQFESTYPSEFPDQNDIQLNQTCHTQKENQSEKQEGSQQTSTPHYKVLNLKVINHKQLCAVKWTKFGLNVNSQPINKSRQHQNEVLEMQKRLSHKRNKSFSRIRSMEHSEEKKDKHKQQFICDGRQKIIYKQQQREPSLVQGFKAENKKIFSPDKWIKRTLQASPKRQQKINMAQIQERQQNNVNHPLPQNPEPRQPDQTLISILVSSSRTRNHMESNLGEQSLGTYQFARYPQSPIKLNGFESDQDDSQGHPK